MIRVVGRRPAIFSLIAANTVHSSTVLCRAGSGSNGYRVKLKACWGRNSAPSRGSSAPRSYARWGMSRTHARLLIEKERRQRAAVRDRLRADGRFWAEILDMRDSVLRRTVHYGHVPLHALWSLAAFWLVGAIVFSAASAFHAIKPNSPSFSEAWNGWHVTRTTVRETGDRRTGSERGSSQLACFLGQAGGRVLSAVQCAGSIQSTRSYRLCRWRCRSSGSRTTLRSRQARWRAGYLWGHITAGWALSLLAVAGFSGLVKSD